jgi:hypothetical protein
MIEVYAVTAIVLAAAGAMAGILALSALGIRKEEKICRQEGISSITGASPGRLASGARVATGLGVRSRRDLALAARGRPPE